MKTSTAIALAFLILVIGFAFLARYKKRHQFQSAAELTQWLASEAVKDANKNNQVALDFTPESIKSVDAILGRIHDSYVKNPSSISVNGLASAYGAYIGEVIRRSEPDAKWERDDPVAGEKSYPLFWGGGRSYPMAWCYKRIVNGDEDNVWVKYRVLKDQREKSNPAPPK